MAVLSHQLDNTFHEPFINILEAKINNLKTKIMIKIKISKIQTLIYLNQKMIPSKITTKSLKHVVLEIIAQFI